MPISMARARRLFLSCSGLEQPEQPEQEQHSGFPNAYFLALDNNFSGGQGFLPPAKLIGQRDNRGCGAGAQCWGLALHPCSASGQEVL
ncbi:hypothetical protein GGTG_11737 [Gaeumannomyces tritici R3-111a-1]|uniref:Uncharacterized protein n=1 Tax=Gaeumannomyces tritici (strain R3-111a-1) TaxID=644352 RepID=J3PE14_GAET3|nr:hypothetical protein GGTG_11737 [Gaeumannomyces tritici R3-111a-1]EJT70714.1 hypothetical protein GGTG_11737 [Gaeumannomyces tritici R3-111a-1]